MSTTVLSADAKAVVKAVEGLSAQVRRVADALSTPVVEYAVAQPTTPDDDQTLRWARRESLLVLLTRLQRGRALTEAEAGTLRHHVETEIREADTTRERAEQAEAAIERVRAVGPDLEYAATGTGLAEPAREAMRDASRRIRAALDGTEQPTTTKEN